MSRIFAGWEGLRAFCDGVRASGRRLVFTNGVFDLFHAGHLDSLRRARALGEVLVVGLNSDESVRRLKGPERPILSLDQRMKVVAAMEYVDAVAPFDDDTPARLIEVVLPDVLAKGGHYQIHEIVGHELVLARGGEVHSLPLLDGRSTTGIVSGMRGAR